MVTPIAHCPQPASLEGASSRVPGCPSPQPLGWGRWEPDAAAAGTQSLETCRESRPKRSCRPGPAPQSRSRIGHAPPGPAHHSGPAHRPDRLPPRGPQGCVVFASVESLWEGREGRQRTESNGGKTGISTLPSAPPANPVPPISTGTALIQDQPGQRLFTFGQLVQWLSRLRLFATPWTAARQASLSITTLGACSNSYPSSR